MSQTKHQFEFHDTVPFGIQIFGNGSTVLRGLGLNTACITSTEQTIKHMSPATGNLQTMSFLHAAHSIG
jgi:hypothetical protein